MCDPEGTKRFSERCREGEVEFFERRQERGYESGNLGVCGCGEVRGEEEVGRKGVVWEEGHVENGAPDGDGG